MTTEQTNIARRPRKMARELQPAAPGVLLPPCEPVAAKPQTKASLVEGLLRQADGASLDDLCQATGWQSHTCRAFLTGLRKKGKVVERGQAEDGITVYRLVQAAVAA